MFLRSHFQAVGVTLLCKSNCGEGSVYCCGHICNLSESHSFETRAVVRVLRASAFSDTRQAVGVMRSLAARCVFVAFGADVAHNLSTSILAKLFEPHWVCQ